MSKNYTIIVMNQLAKFILSTRLQEFLDLCTDNGIRIYRPLELIDSEIRHHSIINLNS